MGTRCFITRKTGDDRYRSIYCQLDGYPEETGRLLAEHYNTPEKLEALLKLGDIYRLGEKLEPDPAKPHHEGKQYQKGVTIAYARDMDETEWAAKDRTMEEMMESEEGPEFIYVFTARAGWEFSSLCSYDARFKSLCDYLASPDKEPEEDKREDMEESCEPGENFGQSLTM